MLAYNWHNKNFDVSRVLWKALQQSLNLVFQTTCVIISSAGADSLEYMTLDGLVSAVTDNIPEKGRKIGHCTACLSGQYPTKLDWWSEG